MNTTIRKEMFQFSGITLEIPLFETVTYKVVPEKTWKKSLKNLKKMYHISLFSEYNKFRESFQVVSVG